MVLVDTSVWVATFRKRDPLDLEALVSFGEIVTCLPVVQEVLQGFRDESAYRTARSAMLNLPMVDSPLDRELFESAVDLYRAGRRIGLSIRSSIDCLIASSALRHGLTILHRDRDYSQLAKVAALRERSV